MDDYDPIIINEAQLLLAEKRTYLASLRTGLALLAIPMGIVSFLIVASKYYTFGTVLPFMIPLLTVCLILAGVGFHLIWRAVHRLHEADRLLVRLKAESPRLSGLLD
ncbi:MAG: hypothetical protein KJ621_17390 [Proteobacteria bacterium]|nr:hypothetical protein [Pseudomonadota bacterium]MBU1741246.1 hypothetical protein [Pseudomonadota bacterium]